MTLSPLPMAKLTVDEHSKANFPYPELRAGSKQQGQINKPAMRPLLEKRLRKEATPRVAPQVLSQEEQRMHELESMLNEAQNRTAVVEQEAYDKAYAAGEKAGLVLGEKRAEQMLETMHAIVLQAEQALEKVQHQSEDSVVDIATSVAEFVIGALDSEQQTTLLLTTQKAVKQLSVELTDMDNLVFAVHANDLSMMARICEDYPLRKVVVRKDIVQGTCQLSSHKQDALVDPAQVMRHAVQHIREQLLAHHG